MIPVSDFIFHPGFFAQALIANDSPTGFFGILLSGGLVGVLILLVLGALSITAAYLLFDQVMTLQRTEILPDGISEAVRQALLTGRPAEADAACRRAPSVLSVVLLSGLSEFEFGWREVEKAVEILVLLNKLICKYADRKIEH